MDKIFYTTNTTHNDLRSISVSFLIHTAVILFFLLWNFNKPEIIAEQEKIISMELIDFQETQPQIEKIQPQKIVAQPIIKPTITPVVENKLAYQNNEIKESPIVPVAMMETKLEKIESKQQEEVVLKSEPVQQAIETKAEIVESKPQIIHQKIEIKQENILKSEPVIYNASSLNNPAPHYPFLSKKMKEEGKVIVRLLINKFGEISNLSLSKSSGYKRLDESAINTVQKWKFIPAKKGSETFDSFVEIPFVFSIMK